MPKSRFSHEKSQKVNAPGWGSVGDSEIETVDVYTGRGDFLTRYNEQNGTNITCDDD